MSSTIPSRLGKYEIRGTLGKGAMGTVYDGWDPVIDRRVAIKTVRLPDANDEEAIEGLARFKREAQAAGRLTHANIVGVFDYGETEDLAYIVMEFVEGRSLKDVLTANERMSAEHAIALMEDVLAGLTYSHGRGVVHRDIKPANIMITPDDRAKIADFGIARIEASSMTQAGTVLGTPAYMSPEQFMGQVVDRRTDIYSCGVMLYQLLTGDRPFDGSMSAIMHKALTTTPPRPSELAVTAPATLDGVVARAMARRPEDRFDTAEEFARALRSPPVLEDAFASDQTIIAPRKPAAAPLQEAPREMTARAAVSPPPPIKRGSKLPIIAGGVVALIFVAGVVVWALLPARLPVAPAPQALVQPAPATSERSAETVTPPTPSTAPPISPAPTSPAPSQQATNTVPPPPEPQAQPTPPEPTRPPPPVQSPFVVAPPAAPEASQTPPAPPPQAAVETPAAPTPAAPTSAPSRTAAEISAALAASVPNLKCFLGAAATAADATVTLSGVVGAGQPENAIRQAVAAANPAGLTWQARSFDGPYCPALDLLRPVASTRAGGMDITEVGGPASLHDNDVIALQVTMPGFAGFLHVAYLQHDATVSPLVPGPGYPQQTYPAHAQIDLGKPRQDFEGWHVGPPFGTDMIVAVVSTAPLFAKALPDSQSLTSYLAALQSAIETVRRRGGNVSAAATILDTKPAK